MEANRAPLHGRTSYYCHLPGSRVMICREDYAYRIVSLDIFDYLYFELDAFRAALKEDCIEYVIYQGVNYKPLCSYPEWFIEAYDNGFIFEEEGYDDFIIYNGINGDILMCNGGVVLRNFKGEITYMERFHFDRYYEILEG